MKIKCLVIDDDPLITDLIKHFCSKLDKVEYCITCNSAVDGLQLISNQDFDLIFLDYYMPGMNGVNILEMKQSKSKVVMVTSNKDFAVDSYNYPDIIDFLVKPVSFQRFQQALEKFEGAQDKQENFEASNDYFFIKDGTKWIRIRYEELLFVKSESNYVSIVLKDKKVMCLMNLKDLVQELPSNFIRVHRSYIVNVDQIEYVDGDELGIQTYSVPVGQSYKSKVKQFLQGDL